MNLVLLYLIVSIDGIFLYSFCVNGGEFFFNVCLNAVLKQNFFLKRNSSYIAGSFIGIKLSIVLV